MRAERVSNDTIGSLVASVVKGAGRKHWFVAVWAWARGAIIISVPSRFHCHWSRVSDEAACCLDVPEKASIPTVDRLVEACWRWLP